ncbi:MAG: hypothetical protein L0387_33765 [Acidobacteria bacterium]|nr:hypothetical protein [Acidobacteriota bacterium]MCI0724356.1 hypothetical protein [Acidobacteriota bacterium]
MEPISNNSVSVSAVGFDVAQTAAFLRRYQFIHRGLMRALSGWMIATPRYEDKYAMTYHLWDHAQHAFAIRERLKELRGGHPDSNIEPLLFRVVDEVVHASSTSEFVAGAYLELTGALLKSYRWYLQRANRSANAPEIQLFRRIVPELEAHKNWAREFLAGFDNEQVARWREYIACLMDEAGGLNTPNERRKRGQQPAPPNSHRFERPRTIAVDERLQRGGLLSLDDRRKLSYEQERTEQFKVYFNELYAAAILASILYDASVSDVPFEFLFDVAHQCWDEIRHSEFGSSRLSQLGLQPQHYDPIVYEQIESLPFLHRFCHLTLNLEVYFMARKRPRVLQYKEHGDKESMVLADVDWSDEINHVRYGKKWIAYFLEKDARSPEDLKNEIAQHIAQNGTGIEPPF